MKRFIAACAFLACGNVVAPDGEPSRGLAAPTSPDAGCSSVDQNPYGVCYPTDAGIPNLCFGPAPDFCLVNDYDPEQRLGINLIVVVVVASWLGPSMDEIDFITGNNFTGANAAGVSWANDLAPLGVVFIDVLTSDNLDTWAAEPKPPNVTNVVDPGLATLGQFVNAAALPMTIFIDPRTMQIRSSAVGLLSENDIKAHL